MSIQEAAIGRQIASAEARAMIRCPEYNASNSYWMRVDELLDQQAKVTANMGSYNDAMMTDEAKKEEENEKRVNEILNNPSPVKKKNDKRLYEEMKDDESNKVIVELNDDDGFDDEGLAVKLERINELTEKGTVSRTRSSSRKRGR